MATFWLLAALAFQQQIFRVPVRLVTVPALVLSRDGRAVTTLHTSDFRLYDNGRLQTVSADADPLPVSLALVVQANRDIREYLRFIVRVGSALDALLVGATGEAAVITYGDEVTVRKPFEAGDLRAAMRQVETAAHHARMVDGGMQGLKLLKQRQGARSRVLLFIGQSTDRGSESPLTALRDEAARENISIYALTLPEIGKAFVSDTFSLQGLARQDRGGFKAGADLTKLIPVLDQTSKAATNTDPFSILTAETGGTQLHFRKQRELEDAISIIGFELRCIYLLSFYPERRESGYHSIRVEVPVPGATVHHRSRYIIDAE